jgi:Protein of unknown function (DUF2892)
MAKNVGGIDRALRIIVGLALIAAAATGMLGVWAYIGIVPLFTSLVSWCPLYQLIGLNSCPVKK